jgi:hypothetical protein
MLILDCLADPTEPGHLLLGHNKKSVLSFLARWTRLGAKALPERRMHRVIQDLNYLPQIIHISPTNLLDKGYPVALRWQQEEEKSGSLASERMDISRGRTSNTDTSAIINWDQTI